MLDDFMLRALLASMGLALVAGPLGCFIVWRRMAYFGDTMAHSALLGVAVGFLSGVDITLGVIAVTLSVALLLIPLQRIQRLAGDTILGILAHSSLSLGLIIVSLMTWLRIDLMSFLVGDVLAVSRGDILVIFAGGLMVLAVLFYNWRALLAMTIDEDLAQAEGTRVVRQRIVFMLLMAAVIAIAIKVVGVLLITSLLIIPAAAARQFARTPEQMALLAALIGMLAAMGGLHASLWLDTPAGPSIVLTAGIFFALSLLPGLVRRGQV